MFNLFKKKKKSTPSLDFSWAWTRLESVRKTHGRREVMGAMAAAAYVHGYDIEVVYRTCTHRVNQAHAEDLFIDEVYGLKTDREHINQQLRLCIEDIAPGFLEADLIFQEKRIRFSKLPKHVFHPLASLVAEVDLLLQPEWDALTISGATKNPISNPEDITPASRRRL